MPAFVSATIVAALCAVPLLLLVADVGRRLLGRGRRRQAAPAAQAAPAPSAGGLTCSVCGIDAAQARWRVTRTSGGPPRLTCPGCGATR